MLKIGDKIIISKGRLKGERGRVEGTTNLNMDYRLIVRRDNKKARDKCLAFRPHELRKLRK